MLVAAIVCGLSGIVVEAFGLGGWGEIGVMIGGFSALWYKLGRMESALNSRGERLGRVEQTIETLKKRCPLL